MTPAQKRLAQQMQQMQQNNAYERMRADRLAARMPARGAPVQAPRPMGQASKMMGVIRRANGGPVNATPTTAQDQLLQLNTINAPVVPAAMTTSAQAPVTPTPATPPAMQAPVTQTQQLPADVAPMYQLRAPAFGGMEQRVYDWTAPEVINGEMVQPDRGPPATVDFTSAYRPIDASLIPVGGINIPVGGTNVPGGGGGGGGGLPDGGISLIPTVVGGGGQDTIPGGQDTIPGGGQDTIPGGGQDTIPGGGQDTIPGGGQDTVPGGGGQDTTPLTPSEQQVVSLYQNLLGRTPGQAGMAYWSNLLNQGASLQDVAAGIRQSAEGQQYAATQLGSIYGDVLNRGITAPGMEYWMDVYNRGASLDDIRQGIQQSPEAQIRSMYSSILGRAADDAGVAYWLNALNRGATLADVQNALVAAGQGA